MNETIRLGQVAGIRIGVNWTVLVILLLILGAATSVFAEWYPEAGTSLHVVAGIVAAVLFFASLLAHELAHAVVAERNQIRCDGIVLWLFGGVARLSGQPRDPGADLRIAGVGPLVSLVLGAAFGGIALIAVALGAEGLPIAVLGWLGVVNLALAVFNLVPAAPLDGGRILRAVLWRLRGDRTSAAISASRAGRFFGFALVALGLARVFLGDLGGFWYVLIGWFIAMAANAEEQHTRVEDALADLRVADVMSRDPVAVPPTLTIQQLLDDFVWRTHYSSFPVVDDDNRPVGLVTLRRLKEVPPDERGTVQVREVAAPADELVLVSPSEPLMQAVQRAQDGEDGRLLVVEDGHLVGIVSPRDISRMFELAELRHGRSSSA